MAKIIIRSKDVGYSAFKSPAMKKLLSNPKIAKTLGSSIEKKQFYEEIKKYKSGGITTNEMREVLGDLKFGTKDSISSEEARVIAGEVIKSGKRYIAPNPNEGKENKIVTRKEELKTRSGTEEKSAKDISSQHQFNGTGANQNPNQQVSGGNNPAGGKRNIYQVLSERRSNANLQGK